VISGQGTRLNGGRFVPVGVPAVYASLEEETTLREVTTRKSALGGRNQIDVGEYPRITYVLSVSTHRNLDLSVMLPSELQNVVGAVFAGRRMPIRKSWLRSGFRRASKVWSFRRRPGQAETSRCIWRTLQLVA
jgi:hypothetical protein